MLLLLLLACTSPEDTGAPEVRCDADEILDAGECVPGD